MGQPDINDKILIQDTSDTRNHLSRLFYKTEQRIGEILKVGGGKFRVDKSALPDGYFEPDVAIESTRSLIEPPIEPAEPPTGEEYVTSGSSDELIGGIGKEKDTEAESPARDHPTGGNHGDRPERKQDIDSASLGEPRAEVEVEPYMQDDHGSSRNRTPGFSENDVAYYEPSDSETTYTPSVSAASDTTTTPRLDFESESFTKTAVEAAAESAAEMNRNMIRDEVSLMLGKFFGGLAEQMKGSSSGG